MKDQCLECSSRTATTSCTQCTSVLCDECCTAIHSYRTLSDHTLTPISQQPPHKPTECPHHPSQMLDNFCIDCVTALCPQCSLNHSLHSTVPLSHIIFKINSIFESIEHSCSRKFETQVAIVAANLPVRLRQLSESLKSLNKSVLSQLSTATPINPNEAVSSAESIFGNTHDQIIPMNRILFDNLEEESARFSNNFTELFKPISSPSSGLLFDSNYTPSELVLSPDHRQVTHKGRDEQWYLTVGNLRMDPGNKYTWKVRYFTPNGQNAGVIVGIMPENLVSELGSVGIAHDPSLYKFNCCLGGFKFGPFSQSGVWGMGDVLTLELDLKEKELRVEGKGIELVKKVEEGSYLAMFEVLYPDSVIELV
ncbi:hypothetical protein P9112_014717 [Eukaryota sp. TZLM1-RC]